MGQLAHIFGSNTVRIDRRQIVCLGHVVKRFVRLCITEPSRIFRGASVDCISASGLQNHVQFRLRFLHRGLEVSNRRSPPDRQAHIGRIIGQWGYLLDAIGPKM